MKKHLVIYSAIARKNLIKLEKNIAGRITNKINFFAKQETPLSYATKIKDPDLGDYRFRIGKYRATFNIKNDGTITILMVLRIKHRKEIYED